MRLKLAPLLATVVLASLVGCDRQPSQDMNANVAPTSSVTPANVAPSPESRDWQALIENEKRKLRDSKIVFNPPAEMQEQKTETMQARISFEDIGADLREGLQRPGQIEEEKLKVSEIMKVTLTGDENAFSIQRIGDEEQVVAGKPYAQWEWRVTPLQSGDQQLILTATAIIFLEGRGEKSIEHTTLKKPIIVKVDRWYSAKQFVTNNWQWLWAVVVVPAAGLLWRLRKGKSEPAK